MTDIITLVFGVAMFIGICGMCVLAGLLEKPPVDRSEDGAESERDVARIVEATQPMPLEVERRRIRAGTAWGQQ